MYGARCANKGILHRQMTMPSMHTDLVEVTMIKEGKRARVRLELPPRDI